MANQQSTIEAMLPMKFVALTGEVVPVTVKRIGFQYDEQSSECELLLEVSGEVCHDILSNEWFHLFQSARRNHPMLETDGIVEIRAVLRPSIARHYAHLERDAEDILDALLPLTAANTVSDTNTDTVKEPDTDKSRIRLNQTECWMAVELKQVVKLPDDLQDGTLNTSMRTYWANDINPISERAHTASNINSLIESYLQSKDIQAEKIDDYLHRLHFYTDTAKWTCLIRLDEDGQFCAIYSIFPKAIPSHLREETAYAFMNENYDLLHGNFEMDEEDGELRFRSTLFIHDKLDTAILGSILAEHLRVMEHYVPLVESEMQS